MSDVPIYINCRDRVTPLRELVAWLEKAGHEQIVMLDNDSSYEPLLDYYRETPHEVRLLGVNHGSRSLWRARMVPDEPFVFTDPDIVPMETTPLDLVEHLGELLDRYPQAHKAGPGLYYEDLPWFHGGLGEMRGMHANPIEPGVHLSGIDTTFARYRANAVFEIVDSLRLDMPYMMRHHSWYIPFPGEDPESRYYLERARTGFEGSGWADRPL